MVVNRRNLFVFQGELFVNRMDVVLLGAFSVRSEVGFCRETACFARIVSLFKEREKGGGGVGSFYERRETGGVLSNETNVIRGC